MKNSFSSENFPTLHKTNIWGNVECKFNLLNILPSKTKLISNINIVPFIGNKCVIIQLSDGNWEIPGGTLEKGETYKQALKRELSEEVGGKLHNYQLFGNWECTSSAEKPYRQHIPHPKFYRLVCFGEIEIDGYPSSLVDQEVVLKVDAVSIETAFKQFIKINRPDLAEIYKLASEIRSKGIIS